MFLLSDKNILKTVHGCLFCQSRITQRSEQGCTWEMRVGVNEWGSERTQTTLHGSGQDGYQAEGWWQTRERSMVLCKWKSCLTLAVGSFGTRHDEREAEAATLQKQGRRRAETRLVLLTAQQESRMNGHFNLKILLISWVAITHRCS